MTDKLKVLISGATGLVGGALISHFEAAGHEVALLLRKPPQVPPGQRYLLWRPAEVKIDPAALEDQDIVIHLGGANLAAGRWSVNRRKVLVESRTGSTRLLAESLGRLQKPPRLFLCASAIGYYGNHPASESVDESSVVGSGFLAELCHDWETATRPASDVGIRTIQMRFGIVLSVTGGALAKLLPFFRIGLGGRSGSGHQIMSWIALAEIPRVIDHLIRTDTLSGPVNLVSPNPVSNREFVRLLAKTIKRPVFLAQPAPVLRLIFGQMARETILAGSRVVPSKLIESEYEFRYPLLAEALSAILSPDGSRKST